MGITSAADGSSAGSSVTDGSDADFSGAEGGSTGASSTDSRSSGPVFSLTGSGTGGMTGRPAETIITGRGVDTAAGLDLRLLATGAPGLVSPDCRLTTSLARDAALPCAAVQPRWVSPDGRASLVEFCKTAFVTRLSSWTEVAVEKLDPVTGLSCAETESESDPAIPAKIPLNRTAETGNKRKLRSKALITRALLSFLSCLGPDPLQAVILNQATFRRNNRSQPDDPLSVRRPVP